MFVRPIEFNMLATKKVKNELLKNPHHQFVGSKKALSTGIFYIMPAIEQIKTTGKEKQNLNIPNL
jgi:hypothetical protein